MEFKNANAIVHVMASMFRMHKLYIYIIYYICAIVHVMASMFRMHTYIIYILYIIYYTLYIIYYICAIWNTDVGRALKYSM